MKTRIRRIRPVGFWNILTLILVFGLAVSCRGARVDGDIEASGTIEAREVRVGTKVGGQILELRANEGDRVAFGDALATIDHASLDIQLRQAEAGAALADSQLKLLREGARIEDIRQAEEALRQAEANLKVADLDARRMRDLAQKGSATPKQLEDAEARLTSALAQRDSIRENIKKLNRLARPEEIKSAEARLAQAQAGVDLLKKTIADCTIVSPASGVITERPFEVGDLVSPGATVFTLADIDHVYVMIYVTENELGRVKLGSAAEVSIDSYPDRIFPGKVTYISSEAEFTPKNIQTKEDRVKLVFGVKIEIENKDGILKPGLPADAVIRMASAK